MAAQQEPIDSPVRWVAEHAREYIATNGESGHIWRGVPTLALTTTGRRSGKLHRTMLIYGQDGDRYLVVASKGGAPDHPQWYLNLVANPQVQVQIRGDQFTCVGSLRHPLPLYLMITRFRPPADTRDGDRPTPGRR